MAYETWHEHAHAQVRSRDVLRRMAERWLHREAAVARRLAFFSWRHRFEQDQGAKELGLTKAGFIDTSVSLMECRRRRVSLGQILRIWRMHIASIARKRNTLEVVNRIICHSKRRDFSCTFGALRDHARRRQALAQQADVIFTGLQVMIISACWQAWHAFTEAESRSKTKLARNLAYRKGITTHLVGKLIQMTYALVFKCWRQYVKQRSNRVHRMAALKCARLLLGFVHAVLASWQSYTCISHRGERIVKKLSVRWRNLHLGRAFGAWSTRVALRVGRARRAQKLLVRWRSLCVYKCVHVLRKHTCEQHRKRKVVQRLLQLVSGNKLQLGFKRWEQVRIGEAKRRAGMCRILARMSCTLQSAALQQWLHAVGEGAVEREERLAEQRTDEIVQRLADRRVRKALAESLSIWKVDTIQGVVARSC